MSGKKIIDGLRDAVAGNFASVTIEGQRWVRQEWQPIQTAPTDGTPVLLHFNRFFHPLIGHCEGDAWGELTREMGFDPFPSQPTHWMPLPVGPHGKGT